MRPTNTQKKEQQKYAEESFVKRDKHCMKWLPYSGSYPKVERSRNTYKKTNKTRFVKDVEN